MTGQVWSKSDPVQSGQTMGEKEKEKSALGSIGSSGARRDAPDSAMLVLHRSLISLGCVVIELQTSVVSRI